MMESQARGVDGVTDHGSGPWNPGIKSQLPIEFLPLSTIFRSENVSLPLTTILERAEFTGLDREELAPLRPERLALHAVLMRVTCEFSVPDGDSYEDLGINFRNMVRTLLTDYVEPRMEEVRALHGEIRSSSKQLAERELVATLFAPQQASRPQEKRSGLLARLGFGARPSAAPRDSIEDRERRQLDDWLQRALNAEDELEARTLRQLHRVCNAVSIRHGRIRGDKDLLCDIIADLVANDHGSRRIGPLLEPWILEGADQEGYRRLSTPKSPMVLNTKGASAAGKSTLRPYQKELVEALGVAWEDFALISPDIWRKYLLDYNTLGEASLYAGTLTGEELKIVDKKLDRYMAIKAKRRGMTNLLIDRFRFDSFSPEGKAQDEGRYLTRFGDPVHIFFMVTPPAETVVRAWHRGLQVGRYKAVDDLLDHNIEAYSGMPPLFFRWALRAGKTVHCEFLDNTVPLGEKPKLIAYSLGADLTILNLDRFLDITRFKKINVDALAPDDVFSANDEQKASCNLEFFHDCTNRLASVCVVDPQSKRVIWRIENGDVRFLDRSACQEIGFDAASNPAFEAISSLFPTGQAFDTGSAPSWVSPPFVTLGALS